jgi:hypothetical protein
VPDPLSLLRLVALIIFIALVAVGLWLLDVAWWVVPPVMAVALLIAWTIEWLAWRGSVTSSVVRETELPAAIQPQTTEEEPASAPPPPLPPLAAPEPVEEAPPIPESLSPEQEPEPQPVAEADPQPVPEPQPEPPPEPEPAPEPDLEPEPEPAPPEPVAHEETVVTQPVPEAIARRPRRFRLRSVQTEQQQSQPEPVAAAAPQPAEAPSVVEFRPRTTVPREWNLWDLERIAREEASDHPERREEWSYLFLHLRQFAHADGSLPADFDPLVRESFGGLLERAPGV